MNIMSILRWCGDNPDGGVFLGIICIVAIVAIKNVLCAWARAFGQRGKC